MIEATLIDYLATELESDNVYAEVPLDPPVSFVIVERTGGARTDRIWSSTVALQSYGESLASAAALNEAVISALDSLPGNGSVSGFRITGSYPYPDTVRQRPRYQTVVIFYHK